MKKQTKHEKIIALYKEGMKPKDIAAKLKINVQMVYAAKYLENKNKKKISKKSDEYKNKIEVITGTVVFRPEPMGPIELVKEKSFFQKIKDFLGA